MCFISFVRCVLSVVPLLYGIPVMCSVPASVVPHPSPVCPMRQSIPRMVPQIFMSVKSPFGMLKNSIHG